MIHIANEVLCITNNYTYKEQFRDLLSSQEDISISFLHNILDAIVQIQTQHFVLIIIDEILSLDNQQLFSNLLASITTLCLNLHTIILVPKIEDGYFVKYISQGYTYITDMSIARHMLPAVLKHLGEFKSHQPHLQRILYKGLTVDSQSNTIYLKDCCVPLPPTGILILLFLIEHSGCQDVCKIQKYLEYKLGRPISPTYVTVNVHRVSKRIKDVTGLDIVKNRYGVGYSLVL